MAVGAIVQDGKLVETASQASTKSAAEAKSAPDGYDKDAFLQLLVAQMKYQDPMEPTSNTEYISQYATFSQVEQLQNMAGAMELTRASSYVGHTVQISTTDSKGAEKTVEGVVDFVKYENNKAYVSVGGDLYSADDISAVIDETYNTAVNLADVFANTMNTLPNLSDLTLADQQAIEDLEAGYAALNTYQRSFIDKSYVEMLDQYIERMKEMIADAEKAAQADKATQEEEAIEKTQETAETEITDEVIDSLLDESEAIDPVEEV